MHGGNRGGSRPPPLSYHCCLRVTVYFQLHPLSFVPHAYAARPTPTHKVLSFRNLKFTLIIFGTPNFGTPKFRLDYLKFDLIIWCANILAH